MFTVTRPSRIPNWKQVLAVMLSLITALMLANPASAQPRKAVAAILAENPTAEGTLFSCLYNGYQQGLSLKQAFEICRKDLLNKFERGQIDLDPRDDGGISVSGSGSEDPVKFGAGACGGHGDPKLSTAVEVPGRFGGYSYGGRKGEEFKNGQWGMYAGLSE